MRNNGFRVSVVIATYNGVTHLAEQLESIAKQDMLPYELIISDDLSDDDTVRTALEFAGRAPFRVEVRVNDIALGYGENFLRASELATGDLIAFCDQDDVWMPTKLARCVGPFEDPKVMMVVHESILADDSLGPQPRRRLRTGMVSGAVRASPMHVPHGSHLLFRRRLLELLPPGQRPVSGYGHHPRQTHDEWAHFAAVTFGDVRYIKDELILFRRHPDAESGFFFETPRVGLLKQDMKLLTSRLRAEAASERASVLRVRAKSMPDAADRLLGWARRYDSLAIAESNRASLQEATSFGPSIKGLARAATQRTYQTQARGGSGWLAFVKDFLQVARRARARS
ncbi:MAG TPA: glycosyltransferase [Acidimicrobiales bacterium]|nr:glycosyltransferase [Acidimicrobiales bacterium]